MTKSIKLNKQLRKAALKRIKPKQVAQLYFAHTTTNGHFNGYQYRQKVL